MAKTLTPLEQKQLSAFVEIIPNRSVHLVQEALETGYYRGVSLLEAQKSLVKHEAFGEFGEGLAHSGTYDKSAFEEFLTRVATDPRGLYDRIKKAVWNNDSEVLDPSKSPETPAILTTGELIPPRPLATQPPPPNLSEPIPTINRTEGSSSTKIEHKPHPQEVEPDSKENEATENLGPLEQPPNSKQESQSQQPSNSPQKRNPLPQKRQRLLDSTTRKKAGASLLPKQAAVSGSRGALGALSDYWLAKDALGLSKWLADKLGFTRLGNALGRFNNLLGLPERFLGNALNNLGSLAGRGLQAGINAGLGQASNFFTGIGNQVSNLFGRVPASNVAASARSATQASRGMPLVGGGFTGGVAAVSAFLAGVSLLTVFFWVLVIGSVLGILYSIYDAESECGKTGTPEFIKTVVNGTTDTQQEKSFTLDEEIHYRITVNYRQKCGGTVDAEVRDTLPANTTYVLGSANSPTYTTQVQAGGLNSLTFEGSQEGQTLIWRIKGLPNNRPFDIEFKVKPTQDNTWIVNEASTRFTVYKTGGSTPLNLTGPSRGLMCVPGLDERLARVMEEAGVSANVSPAIIYAIAKAENGGEIQAWSLDGRPHAISPCGAHGLMQIQHINDGRGINYGPSCAKIGGTSTPPEVWDGLSQKYNEKSGGNIVDADSDKDSVFGTAFYIQERSQPNDKGYMDQLTDTEASKIAISYLGAGNTGYIAQTVNSYKDAYSRQGTCGGGISIDAPFVAQPIPGGANAR